MKTDRAAGAGSKKLVPLEGLRGIAAVIVMLGHLVRGLVPPGDGPLSGLNLVHQRVLNGGAAVAVFFVLSGFILSLPFARDQNLGRIVVAMIKRWPRLAALTTLACLLSWAAILLSGESYSAAAAVTGNQWMASHFNSPIAGRDMSLAAALREGLFRVFWSGEVRFDSPLWTMRIELFASFAIFLAAPALFWLRSHLLRLALLGGLVLLAGTAPPLTFFSDFLVGTCLAMLFSARKMPEFSNRLALCMAAGGIYLFCFSAGENSILHAPLQAILPDGGKAHFIWDAAAALMILVLLGNAAARRIFSRKWAAWLGMLSFPLYLVHVPIMLSAGAISIVQTQEFLGVTGAVLLAAGVTLTLAVGCAIPLAWVDRVWTTALKRWTGLLLPRRTPRALTAAGE